MCYYFIMLFLGPFIPLFPHCEKTTIYFEILSLDPDFRFSIFFFGMDMKDSIDLLQGHYIVSVSRETTPPSQTGGLESVAVSTSWLEFQYVLCISLDFQYHEFMKFTAQNSCPNINLSWNAMLFFFFGYMQPSYVSGFSWNLGASIYCRAVTSSFPPVLQSFPVALALVLIGFFLALMSLRQGELC